MDKPAATRFSNVLRLPDAALGEEFSRMFMPSGIRRKLHRHFDVCLSALDNGVLRSALALHRTVLFSGPPGCGKSSAARGLTNEWVRGRDGDALLMLANGHAVPGGERGASQQNCIELFEEIRETASCGLWTFVVFDEIETLAFNRNGIAAETNPVDSVFQVNALIEQLDLIARSCPNVAFILTTNLHAKLDAAVTGRVDFEVVFGLPGSSVRSMILEDMVSALSAAFPSSEYAFDLQSESWQRLIRETDGLSGRELRHLGVEALCLTDASESLQINHLLLALEQRRSAFEHHRQNGGAYQQPYLSRPQSDQAKPDEFAENSEESVCEPAHSHSPGSLPSEKGMLFERRIAAIPDRSPEETWTTMTRLIRDMLASRAFDADDVAAALERLTPVTSFLIRMHWIEDHVIRFHTPDCSITFEILYGNTTRHSKETPVSAAILGVLPTGAALSLEFGIRDNLPGELNQILDSVSESDAITVELSTPRRDESVVAEPDTEQDETVVERQSETESFEEPNEPSERIADSPENEPEAVNPFGD